MTNHFQFLNTNGWGPSNVYIQVSGHKIACWKNNPQAKQKMTRRRDYATSVIHSNTLLQTKDDQLREAKLQRKQTSLCLPFHGTLLKHIFQNLVLGTNIQLIYVDFLQVFLQDTGPQLKINFITSYCTEAKPSYKLYSLSTSQRQFSPQSG